MTAPTLSEQEIQDLQKNCERHFQSEGGARVYVFNPERETLRPSYKPATRAVRDADAGEIVMARRKTPRGYEWKRIGGPPSEPRQVRTSLPGLGERLAALVAVGDYLYIESDSGIHLQDLQSRVLVYNCRPTASMVGNPQFEVGCYTAVSAKLGGDVRFLVRVERVA